MFRSKSQTAIYSKLPTHNVSPKVTGNEKKELRPPPSPLDFDAFIPWVCLQWHVHDPIFVTIIREEYQKATKSAKPKSSKSLKTKSARSDMSPVPQTMETIHRSKPDKFLQLITVPITTYYDIHGHLVCISISHYRMQIPIKLVQAFSICAPYQHYLTKFNISSCTLTGTLLKEIRNLLLNSNITDICLDGTFLPEGNYYILLEEMPQLRYLSLNRCKIGDVICEKIVQRLDYDYPAAASLQLLDLGCNIIGDKGAKAIGAMLRRNRNLLHINLAGNEITHSGVTIILNALKEFPLTFDEILEMRRERLRYIENKTAVYMRCLNELLLRTTGEDTLSLYSGKVSSTSSKKKRNTIQISENRNPEQIAEMMTKDIVGDFDGPYGPQGIIIRDGYYFGKGNFTLCSLNLAYNNLEYISIKKVNEVLAYQHAMAIKPGTGLMRIVLDGNYIPETCPELFNIAAYLKTTINEYTPITMSVKKRLSCQKMKPQSARNIIKNRNYIQSAVTSSDERPTVSN